VKRKGHVWFISHVLTQLPKEYVYFIVGQGPEEKAIKKIIQTHRLSKRVFLLGQLSHAQLRYVFDETDIYICPNQPLKNNFESFGIAALEAAAMGLPVIASLVDGLSHTIRNEKNGIVVAPTAKDFLKAIYTLRRKTARKHLGEKAKTYTLKHFSWKTTANSYARLFAQLDKTQKSSQQSLAR